MKFLHIFFLYAISTIFTTHPADLVATYAEPMLLGAMIGGSVPVGCGLSTPFGTAAIPCSMKLHWLGTMAVKGALLGGTLACLATSVTQLYYGTMPDSITCCMMGVMGGAYALGQGCQQVQGKVKLVRFQFDRTASEQIS